MNKKKGSESSCFYESDGMRIGEMPGLKTILTLCLLTGVFAPLCKSTYAEQVNPNRLPPCFKNEKTKNSRCWSKVQFNESGDVFEGEIRDNDIFYGKYVFADGDVYIGSFKNGKKHGHGKYIHANGNLYIGGFQNDMEHGNGSEQIINGDQFSGAYAFGKKHGSGTYVWKNGDRVTGLYIEGVGVGLHTFSFANGEIVTDFIENSHSLRLKRLSNVKGDKSKATSLNLIVSNTQPAADGIFTINVQTNADTASLLINGEEQGGRANGDYIVRKVARAGQDTKFTIVATDINGNKDTKTITVSRQVVESKAIYAALNPTKVKKQPERDAVAVVIGISDYRSLPKADYANDDARAFYDYAIRALGVKPENIKLLVDGDAEEAEILKTFRTWVPSRVKSTTDVYVYYSGHGLPTQDGQGLYLLPPRADREVIDDTAIPFSKINTALQLAKPRSVTIFMDACYSGQARSGETLVASARPISLRTENRLFPDGFTVISASQHDQISSSSPDLQHGIFSYYLMRGMEGDADANKDGKITLGEMQVYLSENVGRQAAMMSRKQEPQLIGDANRVLVGR